MAPNAAAPAAGLYPESNRACYLDDLALEFGLRENWRCVMLACGKDQNASISETKLKGNPINHVAAA
jgi:hypothetical protein